MNQDVPVGYIASNGASLHPTDSLARAVELLQSSRSGAIPVMEDGQLRGLVSDREIASGLARDEGATVGSVMTRSVPVAPMGMPAVEALRLLSTIEFPALPVVSPDGYFVGTVGRAELLATLFRRRRPHPVGGMATPLGVYLSDGRIRGGAGDLGLLLTGVFLFAGWFISAVVAQLATLSLALVAPDAIGYAHAAAIPFFLLTFAAWFRLSPIAGYHAAEHQTVHAMERNEALTPERLAMMPREHPRCGTNLAVMFTMFSALTLGLKADAVTSALASLAAYRFFGQWVQRHVTTRRPSGKQLASGVRAGVELLERYQRGTPPSRYPGLLRLWNAGIIQVAAGYAAVYLLVDALAPHTPFVREVSRFLQ